MGNDQSGPSDGLTSGKRSVSMDASESRADCENADPELARLKSIPSFLPIIRTSTNSTAAAGGGGNAGAMITKDPDILEALDHRGLAALAQRYQHHLRFAAGVVSTEQAEICRRVRDVDEVILEATTRMTTRQRAFNKHSEAVKGAVGDMAKILNKCHLLLNENIEQIEVLNNMLPVEERLEPFVWTTG